MPPWSDADLACMKRALALAARGRGRVEPNPMVGCLIARAGRVLAEGYHRRFGGPHAEAEALARCPHPPHNATVYVTLEPCSHHGKTPPCTAALIAARPARLVVAMPDPFEPVAGRGLLALRRAGIHVQVGLCLSHAARLNAAYLKHRRTGRPWVILKWAQSLDGKIATRAGRSRWISSPRARRAAHRLRARVDAVIVGSNTARIDNPLLTARAVPPRRIATRIVIDSRLLCPPDLRLVRTARRVPTIIATTRHSLQHYPRRARKLQSAGCELLALPTTAGHVRLAALLDELGQRQMCNVLVEGGGGLLGAFFDQRLADELVVFIAHRLIGGAAAPGPLGGRGVRSIARAVRPVFPPELRRLGPDLTCQLLLTDPTRLLD